MGIGAKEKVRYHYYRTTLIANYKRNNQLSYYTKMNCLCVFCVSFHLPCRLAGQQGDLEVRIAQEEAAIKIKEEKLSSVLPALEGIRKATLPLQESLGVPLDKKREEQEMALLLPT